MTLVWAGYSVGLYGYSLVRGYNLTLAQMVSPTKWYSGQWPPAKAGNEQILPTGNAAGLQTTALVVANAPAGNAANSGNAAQQARWMMGYIKSAYGSPANAWGHELSNNWY